MKSYIFAELIILAIMSSFCAYTIVDKLIRDLGTNDTIIDLGVLYLLGLMSGLAIGFIFVFRKKESLKSK
jgi:hypothetical protein